MSKIHLGLLVFSLLASTFSQRIARFYDDEVDRGDKFIDDLLHDMIVEHGHEYDPYNMEDSAVGFSKKVMFVNVTGEAKLFKGYIIGLSTLHRADHCVVQEEGDKIYVKADLGAGIIKCHYDGTVKFMNWGPTISIYGEIVYLETHMEFSVDSKTGQDGELHKFLIDDMKGMTVTISGLGPLNWAANYLVGGTTSLFKGFIKGMLESQVRKHLSERLPNYIFPVDNPNTDAPETEVPEEEGSENLKMNVHDEIENRSLAEPEAEDSEEQKIELPKELAERYKKNLKLTNAFQ